MNEDGKWIFMPNVETANENDRPRIDGCRDGRWKDYKVVRGYETGALIGGEPEVVDYEDWLGQ